MRWNFVRHSLAVGLPLSWLAAHNHMHEGHQSMTEAMFARAQRGLLACGLLLSATVAAGCSNEGYGTVPAAPESAAQVVGATPSGKRTPAPRVPRGPGAAKALEDAKQDVNKK